MQKIAGIGGVFMYVHEPNALAAWYRDVLGIPLIGDESCGNHYCELNSANGTLPPVVFSIAPPQAADESQASSGDRSNATQQCTPSYMLNFRVENLDAFLAHLRDRGIHIERTEDYSYGRFAWIVDSQGRKIELYERLAST